MHGQLYYHQVLSALANSGAKFVVVGGIAMNLQGVPRFTADLDLIVELSSENLTIIGDVLTRLGLTPRLPVPLGQLADPDIVDDWVQHRNLKAFTFQDVNNPMIQVDLLLSSPVSFDQVEASKDVVSARGLSVPVASTSALIEMKRDTGRQQDVHDVRALEQIARLENGE